jgi:hypothetical protein
MPILLHMKIALLFALLLTFRFGIGQLQSPVNWSFAVKKLNSLTYEVHLNASMNSTWYIYSQTTPKGGADPTKIKFTNNPLIVFQGPSKEMGNLQKKHEPLLGVDIVYFAGNVDFVQTLKLKTPVKTQVSGSIDYMVCNDELCTRQPIKKFLLDIK